MAMEQGQNVEQRHAGEVSSPVDARQGVISGRVLTVLAVSLVLAVIALTVGYFIVR